MRISAKGEYAIKAMLDLAMQRGRPLVPIQEIAARQAIPQRYLEQVLLALKRRGYRYDASTFPTFVGPLALAATGDRDGAIPYLRKAASANDVQIRQRAVDVLQQLGISSR